LSGFSDLTLNTTLTWTRFWQPCLQLERSTTVLQGAPRSWPLASS
jgi:hypothetical protein